MEDKGFSTILAVSLILLFSAETLSAQYDLSGNGEIDLALTVQKEGEPISWFAYSPVSKEVSRIGEFGQAGWQVNVAPWLSEGSAKRAYVRKLENSEVRLKVEGEEQEFSLGEFPYETRVTAGRQIDRGGLADIAVIYQNDKRWHWKLFLNPFSDKPEVKNFTFGRKASIPFLYRHRGRVDSLASLKVRERRRNIVGLVRLRSLRRKRTRRFRIRGFSIPETSPMLIRSSRGCDDLVFLTSEPLTDFSLMFRASLRARAKVTSPIKTL